MNEALEDRKSDLSGAARSENARDLARRAIVNLLALASSSFRHLRAGWSREQSRNRVFCMGGDVSRVTLSSPLQPDAIVKCQIYDIV